jgi:hypothetical protein
MSDHDFDVAHFNQLVKSYGGQVQRRYPTRTGETDFVRTTPEHEQGLPHGFAFIVKRLFDNKPGPILPVFQNTCYPPNQPTPKRSYQFGQAIAQAVKEWEQPARVAIAASGGLSHFVVDEEFDRCLLKALRTQRTPTRSGLLPRELVLGDRPIAQLGRGRRGDAGQRPEDGIARLRARVPHAGRDWRGLGLRALAVSR